MNGCLREGRFKMILDKNVREAVIYLSGHSVLFVNDSFFRLFFAGKPMPIEHIDISGLFSDRKLLARLREKAIQTEIVEESPVECIASDNTRFYCSISVTNHEDSAENVSVLTLLDITDRIRQEKLLKNSNEELKKLNTQLDRFLYSASHDIRQPLTSMMGLIRLLQMEYPHLSENQYITKLNESVFKLDEFLHQVILFTKNSHVQVKAERVDVVELIRSRVVALRNVFDDRAFPQIQIEVSGEAPFYSDSERLQVIVDHLLQNAVQYSDPFKPHAFVKVLISYGMKQLFIEVVDNGIGIARVHLDKVTEMFYRATASSKGSGLGLYIVKETLSKLGGRITIDSEINLGTMVIVEIPNDRKGILINKKRLMSVESRAHS